MIASAMSLLALVTAVLIAVGLLLKLYRDLRSTKKERVEDKDNDSPIIRPTAKEVSKFSRPPTEKELKEHLKDLSVMIIGLLSLRNNQRTSPESLPPAENSSLTNDTRNNSDSTVPAHARDGRLGRQLDELVQMHSEVLARAEALAKFSPDDVAFSMEIAEMRQDLASLVALAAEMKASANPNSPEHIVRVVTVLTRVLGKIEERLTGYG